MRAIGVGAAAAVGVDHVADVDDGVEVAEVVVGVGHLAQCFKGRQPRVGAGGGADGHRAAHGLVKGHAHPANGRAGHQGSAASVGDKDGVAVPGTGGEATHPHLDDARAFAVVVDDVVVVHRDDGGFVDQVDGVGVDAAVADDVAPHPQHQRLVATRAHHPNPQQGSVGPHGAGADALGKGVVIKGDVGG